MAIFLAGSQQDMTSLSFTYFFSQTQFTFTASATSSASASHFYFHLSVRFRIFRKRSCSMNVKTVVFNVGCATCRASVCIPLRTSPNSGEIRAERRN